MDAEFRNDNPLTPDELDELVEHVKGSPSERGTLDLIVPRPAEGERVVQASGELAADVGLVGDNWIERSSSRTEDGGPHPDMQLNIINSRFSSGIARGDETLQALAGDQLHVDFDLSEDNAKPGTRLAIGDTAVIEITDQPHTGCAKFVRRFGMDAKRATDTDQGRDLHLRGLNARVHTPGPISQGDVVRKLM